MKRNVTFLNGQNRTRVGYVPTLSISPALLEFEEGGGMDTIAVNVGDDTQEWDYEISDSWILVSYASKIGDDPAVRIDCLSTYAYREGAITFTSASCANKVLTIIQNGDIE